MFATKLSRYTPLCFMDDGGLLCYQYGDIVLLNNGIEQIRYPLFRSTRECLLGHSKLLSRLFRFDIRAAVALGNQRVLLSKGSRVFELDMAEGSLSAGWDFGEGIRPLQFSTIEDVDGFEDGVYFGGYVHNYEKKPVSVYRRVDIDQWETVYTFKNGEINHVHNIVVDSYRKCLWIFTGDFDEAAAIWKVTDGFKTVERIRYGDQRWRGSVVFVLKEGLLYATDTPRADDYLYFLNPQTIEQTEVMPLPGSCIYGCQWKDNYVIATTVEGDGGDMSFIKKWFGRKRGRGIKDEYVHMFCGNLDDGFREIYKEKKDRLPFTLFQFGVFKFPSGVNKWNTLYFQPVATNKNDLRLMAIEAYNN